MLAATSVQRPMRHGPSVAACTVRPASRRAVVIRAQHDGFSGFVATIQRIFSSITGAKPTREQHDILNKPRQFPGPNYTDGKQPAAQASSEGSGTSPEMQLRAQEMQGGGGNGSGGGGPAVQRAGMATQGYLEGAVKGVLTGANDTSDSQSGRGGSVVEGWKGDAHPHRKRKEGFHNDTR